MKIVMTLLVRDEQDIIQHNIEFHRSQGIDFFIVTDHLSNDGTSEILRQYEREGVVHYIREDDEKYDQGAWVTRMARLAYCDYKADWVINNDADEFWWPLEDDLRSVLSRVPEGCNIMQAKMHNFVPTSESSGFFYERMIYREKIASNLLGRPLLSKVCHRGCPGVIVGRGSHKLEGIELPSVFEGAVEVLHFPLRTYDQFERKTVLGGQAYEKNRTLRKGVGIVRRGLYQLYKKGKLPEYYQLQSYPPRRIKRELQEGFIVKDTRLAEYLRQYCPLAIPGDTVHQDNPKRITNLPVSVSGSQPELSDTETKLWQVALQRYCRGHWSLEKLWWVIRPAARFTLRSLTRWSRQRLRSPKR